MHSIFIKKISFLFLPFLFLLGISIFLLQGIVWAVSVEDYVLRNRDLPGGWRIVEESVFSKNDIFIVIDEDGLDSLGKDEKYVWDLSKECGFRGACYISISINGQDGPGMQFELYGSEAGAEKVFKVKEKAWNLYLDSQGKRDMERAYYGDGGVLFNMQEAGVALIFRIKNVIYSITGFEDNCKAAANLIDTKRKGFVKEKPAPPPPKPRVPAPVKPPEPERSPEELFREGRNLYSKDKYKEAIECFKDVLRSRPNNKDTYDYLGRCYRGLRNYHMAADNYRTAASLSADTKEKVLFYAKIVDMYRIGDMTSLEKGALQDLIDGFLPMDSEYAIYYIRLMEAYQMDGEYEKAMDLAFLAKRFFKNDSWVQEVAGRVERRYAEIQKKEKEKVLAKEYLEQGIEAFKRGEYKRADSLLLDSYNYDWKNDEVNFWRARTKLQLDNFNAARKSFKKAEELTDDPDKKRIIGKWLDKVDKAEKEKRAPKLSLRVIPSEMTLRKGERKELQSVRVRNTGAQDAKDVMVDVRGAVINPIAEVSASDCLYIGDIKNGDSRKYISRVFVSGKEAGQTTLVFRAVCENGKPSEEYKMNVTVKPPKTEKIPEVSERIKIDGKPVQQVAVKEETRESYRKPVGKEWIKTRFGVTLSVLIKGGVCVLNEGLIGLVDTPIVIEVKVFTKKQAVSFLFQPMLVADVTDPANPKKANVGISQGTWEFSKGWGRTKTVFTKSFVVPMYALCSTVLTDTTKLDVRVPRHEEVELVASITPRQTGTLKISWDYPYTFSESAYSDSDYERYERFKGEMHIEVLGEESSIK